MNTKTLLRNLFSIIFFLFLSKTLSATHIVGGEMTYRCLGQNQYEIKLQVFRDCYTGVPDFDSLAWVSVYDANWKLKSTLKMLFNKQRDTLPIILSNPCLSVPPNVCVNTTTFLDTITLPFLAGGYTLVYQRCCRNQLIRNIYDPLDTGASFLVQITEDALAVCNAGCIFKSWPPVAICVNHPIDFDHGATDSDGDSLVYKLCTPLKGGSTIDPKPEPPPPGPYDLVDWKSPPYNLTNVLGGQPLTIDPKTGFLTGVPNTIGNFVVGICVEEYRNGTLLGTTRRDFQYNVADCGEPAAAFFAPEFLCDSKTLKFQNQSQNAANYQWLFDFPNANPASNLNAPTYTFPDTGNYTIALIANSTNGTGCLDTFLQEIKVRDRFVEAFLKYSFPDCTDSLTLAAANFSTDTVFGVQSWLWTLRFPDGTSQSSTLENPEFTIKGWGLHVLQLEVVSKNGCRDTITQKFAAPLPDLSALILEWQICQGDSIHLNPNPVGGMTYLWSPTSTLDIPIHPDPLAFPTKSTVYTVVATSTKSPCTTTGQVTVEVLNPGSLVLTADPPKIFIGSSTQLTANMPGVDNYTWDSHPTLSSTSVFDPAATPTDTTEYFVTASLSGGCEVRGSILVPVIFPNCDEPFVFFPNAFSPNGDSENDVLKLEGIYIATVFWVIYDRWGEKIFEANSLDDFWDGTFKGQEMPTETYGFYLNVTCPNGTFLEKKGNVTLLR